MLRFYIKDSQKIFISNFHVPFTSQTSSYSQCYREKIFKPFTRLHNKNTFKGTGIGLSICKKIVDIHNGSIVVESNEDGGTTFIVSLASAKQNRA